jgi:CubicO group peptidase (beta-lactamase class C family)
MKTDTIFAIMSMTKPVTAVAVAILAEEGKLSFLDPVARHLREFAGRKETVRDLLTHTSGMPEYGPPALRDIFQKWDWTLKDVTLLYSQQAPLFEPGSKWQYSNPGIDTLGRIVEVVSGMSYERFCEERIFKPLGMADTSFYAPADKRARVAMAYVVLPRTDKAQPLGPLTYRPGSVFPCPACGLYSTTADYARFLTMMLDGGKGVISPEMVRVMTANHTGDLLGPQRGWGLGWSLDRQTGGYGHGGAFGTLGWVDPRRKTVRVFMVQKFGASIDEVRNAFLNISSAAVN